MRILFTHSYFLRFDPKQWAIMQPYAPLGTIYAASVIRQQGDHEVALHDVMFAKGPADIEPLLNSFNPDVLVIYDDGFNYLTKMCLTNMREAAFEMSRMAKERDCTVIVSSSDSTDHFEKYLQHDADYIIIGEAEQTLLELLRTIETNRNVSGIEGLAYYENGGIVRTATRKVMTDLDSLPTPAWDLIDINAYRKAWLESTGYFSINMGTTRGCPYKCNWCAKPIYGNRYNARSPENVVNELKQLYMAYQFDHVWFCDDIFGLKPGWVKQFAQLVKESGLKFKFKIQSRADLLLNDEQIEYLAQAGCEVVWMGAESGSQKILDAMDKGTTIHQIAESTSLLKKHGIKPAFFLQFGYLGETMEDIEKTLQMLQDLVPADIGISVSYPLPGTKFFEKVQAELGNKTNWTDSDELALMFKNTYKPEFYKQLHRYVHAFYRTIKAKSTLSGIAAIHPRNFFTLLKLPYYNLQLLQEKRKLDRAL